MSTQVPQLQSREVYVIEGNRARAAGCGAHYAVEVVIDCRRLVVLSYQVMPLMFQGTDKVPTRRAPACT
jgi:hypothetical protein